MNLVGRPAYGKADFHRVIQQCLGKLADLLRHRCREHYCLVLGGQVLGYLQDIVRETHVEHAVGLVKDEEGHAREVYVAERQVADEPSGGGNDDVCSLLHAALFLLIAYAVVSTVHGNGTDVWQMV